MTVVTTPPSAATAPRSGVPVRTILATIALVLATLAALYLLSHVTRILVWSVVAAFFAVALAPVVGWLELRMPRRSRTLATLVVFLIVLVVLAGLGAVFAVPLAQQGSRFAGQLPELISQARAGEGPVGSLLERTNALEFVRDNEERIRSFATGLTTPATGVLKGFATGIAAVVSIFVLAFLMVLEGPRLVAGSLNLLDTQHRGRVRQVADDCARSITGYISGNLLISVICGVLTYIMLRIAGIPFAGLLALFVAIADLVPLVGATLGAVVVSAVAFIHSVPAGIAALIFFVIYQQLENHLLQPVIFARTVQLNPLTVIIAVLAAAELGGILAALLAIPIAGMVQTILRDLWRHRRSAPEDQEPTTKDEAEVEEPISSQAPLQPS